MTIFLLLFGELIYELSLVEKAVRWVDHTSRPMDSQVFGLPRPPMGYLGDGRLGLNFGRFGRIDPNILGDGRLNWSGSK